MGLTRRRLHGLASGMLVLLASACAAHAQGPRALPRIALVDTVAATSDMTEARHPYWGITLVELRRLGHAEGQNVVIDRWSGRGAATAVAYKDLARRIAASEPQVIVVRARSMLVHIAVETKTIPIVAIGSIPPDLRVSLSRPGGNVTGIDVGFDAQQLYGKQVEVLRDVLKPGARIAWLGPKSLWDSIVGEAQRKGAASAGVTLRPFFVTPVNKPTLRRAFADMARAKSDGLLISPATEFFSFREIIAELAVSQRLATLASNRLYAEGGALITYGVDFERQYGRLASYVDRILKGAAPATLPIEQPDKIELVINLETAKAIGVAIAPSLLARADRVIE